MGDTAYPLRPWLMTVYGGNPGGARGVYNTALCKTRNGDDLDDLPDQGQNRSILAMDQGPQDVDGIDANEGQARRNLFLNHFTRQHR